MLEAPSRKFNLSLLGLALLNMIPHLGIHAWVIFLVGIPMIVWRFAYEHQKVPLPSTLVKVLLISYSIFIVQQSYTGLSGVESATGLLISAISLKLLDSVRYRDAMVVLYTSFFVLMSSFLEQQNLAITLFAALDLILITALLFQLHKGKDMNFDLWTIIKIGGRLVAATLPLLIILFVIFPRFSGSLLNFNQKNVGSSGFSDKMEPGSIDQLVLSDEVAFRVEFEDFPPPQDQLYWRGSTFAINNGLEWKKLDTYEKIQTRNQDLKGDYVYEVILHEDYGKWIFALDYPSRIQLPSWRMNRHLRAAADKTYRFKEPIGQKTLYRGASDLIFTQSIEDLSVYLQMPESVPEEIQDLVRTWKNESEDVETYAKKIYQYYAKDFRYTLEPGSMGENSMATFLLEKKQGFCEHFATSFAYLMRAAGYPSRVVAGFQGGRKNKLSDYFIVSNRDAHAWAEVYNEAKGRWQRFDPTSVVAPLRLELGGAVYFTLSEEERDRATSVDEALKYYQNNFLVRYFDNFSLAIDFVQQEWNQFLLDYDYRRQKELLRKLGLDEVSKGRLFLYSVLVAILFFIVYRYRKLRSLRLKQSKAQQIYQKLQKHLAKKDIVKMAHEGPQTYLERAQKQLPDKAEIIEQFQLLYLHQEYGPEAENDQRLTRLQQAYKEIKS
tara:strand:+ start:8750 stop:10744 length:1995 start_codon:yes stop_codon:yes gene_type:complete